MAKHTWESLKEMSDTWLKAMVAEIDEARVKRVTDSGRIAMMQYIIDHQIDPDAEKYHELYMLWYNILIGKDQKAKKMAASVIKANNIFAKSSHYKAQELARRGLRPESK